MSVPVDPQSREDGFEHRDVNIKALLYIGFGLLATVGVSLAGVGLLVAYYNAQPEALVTALERDRIIPPQPRLESDPRGNGEQLNHAADSHLARYAWVDRDAGVARIPLERARALLLRRGWPEPVEASGDKDVRLQQAKRRADP